MQESKLTPKEKAEEIESIDPRTELVNPYTI